MHTTKRLRALLSILRKEQYAQLPLLDHTQLHDWAKSDHLYPPTAYRKLLVPSTDGHMVEIRRKL